MRWRTFMIGWTMALAVLLISHPKPPAGNEDVGTAVVELTYAAPNSSAKRQWNANVGHAARIVAPLVELDVTPRTRADANCLLSLEDIARWEELHGHVPPNAVVMARSDVPVQWRSQPESGHVDGNAGRFPGFSEDAIRFLVEGRYAYGLGTETPANGRSVVLVYRGTK